MQGRARKEVLETELKDAIAAAKEVTEAMRFATAKSMAAGRAETKKELESLLAARDSDMAARDSIIASMRSE